MKVRIPLQIVDGRLIATTVIECKRLRVRRQFMKFVIDTDSSESYISTSDVKRLQIPIKDKASSGIVDFGGSRFNKVLLPPFTMFLLKEDKQKNDYIALNLRLSALKTTKASPEKVQVAEMLPSILGIDFLREQKLILHVAAAEEIAFLEYEE